jgi:hypothetical protein
MSSTYYIMNFLANQSDFNPRVTFCCVQQSETYINDARAQFVSMAKALLTGNGPMQYTFVRMVAAGPGMAAKADTGQTNDLGQPIVDQSLILDEDILAAVQADFPTVAALYFNEDGTPVTPAP